jgi:hypothetical protein
MANLTAKVLRHHRKADGSYNVKICVYHNSVRAYIDTEHYVTEKKLTEDLQITDTFIISLLEKVLGDYRKAIRDLGPKLKLFSAQALKDYLIKKDDGIDFLEFCQIHVNHLNRNGQGKNAANYNTVRNHLCDFFNKDKFPIAEISVGTLDAFVRFLKSDRKVIRRDKLKEPYTVEVKGVSDASIHNYLRDFSGFFSAARTYYNKPSLGITLITYNPFSEYKILDAPETRKRNITIQQVIKIKNCVVKEGSRAELARDMFMLSFYLCGINAVDLYFSKYVLNGDRIEYNRSKTKGKRKDKAFISIKIPYEAKGLILKYQHILSERYSTNSGLNKALSKGMRQIQVLTEIPDITFYWARHTFGNIARNKCRKSKDDVALALNHVDNGRKTTDIYLEKDWTIVDEVQDAVIKYLRRFSEESNVTKLSVVRLFEEINLNKLYA